MPLLIILVSAIVEISCFSINSISIAQLQSKEELSPLYEINGAFRLPNRQVGNSSPEEKDLTR